MCAWRRTHNMDNMHIHDVCQNCLSATKLVRTAELHEPLCIASISHFYVFIWPLQYGLLQSDFLFYYAHVEVHGVMLSIWTHGMSFSAHHRQPIVLI